MGRIERDIHITGVGSELQGVGRAADGRTLFVYGALPGERADVRVVKEGSRFLTGESERILQPSDHRTQPPCPDYGRCGGCAALHMEYPLALRLKTQKVQDALRRIGGIGDAPVGECIASPALWRYRNKAEYACRGGAIGATERAGHGVVEMADCLLQHEASIAFLDAVRGVLGNDGALGGVVTRTNAYGDLMGVLCIRHGMRIAGLDGIADALVARVPALRSLYVCALSPKPNHALDGSCRLLRGSDRLPERLCGLDYALSPHTFFQVNRDQAEALVRTLLDGLALSGTETVVDLYCGIGTLTLPLAQRARRAIGVEVVPPAIEDARRAASANGIDNAEFLCGDAGAELIRLTKRGLKPDVVVVDPPRKGLDPKLVAQLIDAVPAKIGYVSCDCATLARDVRLLIESGLYHLDSAQPVDMFPWTEHVETCVLMSRVE